MARWMKAELHCHTSDDPQDAIPHSGEELIDRASSLGYEVVSITNHHVATHTASLARYASSRGVLLIPGVELTLEGKHVVLINPDEDYREYRFLEDLKRRSASCFVLAPHPFFPHSHCLGKILLRAPELVDGVEWSHLYVPGLNFNKSARRWADVTGKPLIGSSDAHFLKQMGTCYSLVFAEPDPENVVRALKQGQVRLVAEPLSVGRFVAFSLGFLAANLHLLLTQGTRAFR